MLATSIAKAIAFADILNVLKTDHDTTCNTTSAPCLFSSVSLLPHTFRIVTNVSGSTDDEAPIFYWTIPESCVAVIGACLPTIRPIFLGWSPESIVGSIRSIMSLGSLDSQGRSRRTRTGYSRDIEPASESATHFTQPSADREQKTTISLDSIPSAHLRPAEGEIRVQRGFQSTEEHV